MWDNLTLNVITLFSSGVAVWYGLLNLPHPMFPSFFFSFSFSFHFIIFPLMFGPALFLIFMLDVLQTIPLCLSLNCMWWLQAAPAWRNALQKWGDEWQALFNTLFVFLVHDLKLTCVWMGLWSASIRYVPLQSLFGNLVELQPRRWRNGAETSRRLVQSAGFSSPMDSQQHRQGHAT